MRSILLAASLIALAAQTVPVLAWDDEGHMIVAAVAYDQLLPQTKARVAQLLALSQYPTNGVNNVSADDAAKAAFVMAATAPDAIKKDKTHYTNDGEDPSKAPDADRNTGFDDKNMHKCWHYVDIPFSPDGTPLVQPPGINAEERIALFRKTLASDAPDELKAYDLVWLLHLVGDVHQPLHATSRFTRDAPEGDRGGNAIKLCDTPNCSVELHAFWDDALGKSENVSAAIRAANALPKPDQTLASETDEAAWIQESFQIAQQDVYVAPIGPGNGPFSLTDAYKQHAKEVARERVALAGARLANLLNTELK
jgi:hypothetical protein